MMLDLDDPSTWSGSLRQVVYADSTFSILLDYYHVGREKPRTAPCPHYVSDPSYVSTQSVRRCDPQELHDVAAYHACLTDEPNRYRKLGILTSSRERLTGKAKDLFDGITGLETALAACDSYFHMYGGSVSLYSTARHAPTCYLSGSHYWRWSRIDLGLERKQDLAREARGRPVLSMPIAISWLERLELERCQRSIPVPVRHFIDKEADRDEGRRPG